MRAIMSRPLVSRRHEPMEEWNAAIERLAEVCPNRSRTLPHRADCLRCEDTLAAVLLASLFDDTAPLPLLDAVIERYERTVAA